MKKLLIAILLLSLSTFVLAKHKDIDLEKSKHTEQDSIVSLLPLPAQANVYPDSKIEIVFNVELDEKHINNKSIKLRHLEKKKRGKKKKIKGCVAYDSNTKTLSFKPDNSLEAGIYEVEIKAIKAVKNLKHHNIKNIKYRFSVVDIYPTSLRITPNPIEVNKDSTLELNATIIYNDGSENQGDGSFTWVSRDEDILNIEQNGTAIALKEGQTVVTASYKGVISEEISVLVYVEINGHRLPPEPDETINNSTLLGIDVNDNGVRDDVERYVILRFSQEEFPKTRTALAMQYAWAKQKIIETPIRESAKYSDDVLDCEWYWFDKKQETQWQQFSELLKIDRRAAAELDSKLAKWRLKYSVYNDNGINNIVFNTRERIKQDFAFNGAMSGGFFPGRDESIDNCQVNIDLFGEYCYL